MDSWIAEIVRKMGPLGVGLLMFAENVFPPLPSELIMPLAGYLAARGEMAFWPAVVAGSIGSLAGAGVWYAIGRRLTPARLRGMVEAHGTWLAMTPADVDHATAWFERRGRWSVLVGRMLPVVRTLVSVPAGFARMPPGRFFLLSAIGTTAWTAGLAAAGHLLGARFAEVDRYVGPLSWVVIAVAVVSYARRVYRIRKGELGA
ncbi:MAG TPA: DedA family protein [Longimicrobium sp.]|jgi:membrane protein DedA with SNARE-associated domain